MKIPNKIPHFNLNLYFLQIHIIVRENLVFKKKCKWFEKKTTHILRHFQLHFLFKQYFISLNLCIFLNSFGMKLRAK